MHLEIDGWKQGIKFSSSHFIVGHNKCGRLHGHNYSIRLRIEGETDENHMVLDFVEVKKALRTIAEKLDHRILLPEASEYASLNVGEESVEFIAKGKRYVFPREDVSLLPIPATSAEELAKYVYSEFLAMIQLPPTVRRLEIAVDEEEGQGVWYCPEG